MMVDIASGFREFDEVTIAVRANVRWLFTGPGDLGGSWVVTSVIGNELVLARGELLISIPKRDVQKVSAYSVDALLDHIERLSGYG